LKEVIPIPKVVVEKIHMTYRMEYIKDVILARLIEENTYATLSALVVINNTQIIIGLASDEEFITKFFQTLEEVANTNDNLMELLLFVSELCDMGCILEEAQKIEFFSILYEKHFIELIEKFINNKDNKVRLVSTKILLTFAENDSHTFIQYMCGQKNKAVQIINVLIKQFLEDPDTAVKTHIYDILCIVLTIETEVINEFVDIFFEQYFSTLMAPLGSPVPSSGIHTDEISFVKSHLCELLSLLIKRHTTKTANAIIQNNIINTLLKLFSCKETFLYLDVIRLFRSIIEMKDTNILNKIVEENIFHPIIEKFIIVKDKKNLLNSAILELFNYIVSNNMKILIIHIYNKYFDKLKTINYVNTFELLEKRFNEKEKTNQKEDLNKTEKSVHPIIDLNRERFKKEFLEREREDLWLEGEDDDEEFLVSPSLKRQRESDEDIDTQRNVKQKSLQSVDN